MAGMENIRTVPAHDYPVPNDLEDVEEGKPEHPLDSEAARAKHRRLMEWYQQEREKQAINRYQQAIDEDFYDGLQWSDEDAEELKARGQAPLVFNEVKPVIDWIVGTERRMRIDYKVLPREEDDHEGAVVKTKVLKYVSDVNKAPFARSAAFAQTTKVGVGWIEEGIRRDPGEEPLYVRMESWRNVLYDSNSVERDISVDSRYLFRHRWIDLDIAQAAFPDRKEQLRQASVASEIFGPEQDEDLWYLGQHLQERDSTGAVMGRRTYISDAMYVNNRRERVKLIECWYRDPTTVKVMRGDHDLDGQIYDERNAAHVAAVKDGAVSLYDMLYMKMRVAIMTEGHLIADMPSPYRHNRFPFTPIWGYRRGRDNAPYGAIRGIRDPQEDLNKRASKALYLLSVNRVVYDEGAFEDPDEAREELSRPDAFVAKRPGKEVNLGDPRAREMAETHIRVMEQDAARIRQVAGVTGENLGLETNATSGRAIIARQTQGSVVTTELFDNLRFALQISGEKQLSLIEQFYTDRKVIRITGNRGAAEFVKINHVDPDTGELLNDITARQADFVIGEQDYAQTLRIAMFETLLEMVSKMPPEVALKFLDLVFELSDLPNKDDIVSRLRKVTGMVPEGEKLSPEEQQEVDEVKAAQAKANAMQEELLQGKIEELAAKIEKLRAEAARVRRETEAKAVETQGKAVETAASIASLSGVAPVADHVLQSAGYQDAGAQPQA